MKKIIAIFVGLVMLMSTFSVFASDVDLSGKSIEELIALRDAVDDAIFAAGGKTVINSGKYVVGRDIAAGTYLLSVYDSKGMITYDIWRDETSDVKWYEAQSESEDYIYDYSPYLVAHEEYVIGYEGGKRITLEEGQVLELEVVTDGATMTIEKAPTGGLFMDEEEAPMIAEE